MRPWHPVLGVAGAVTIVLAFLVAVFLAGLLIALAHLAWRARQDRRAAELHDPTAPRR